MQYHGLSREFPGDVQCVGSSDSGDVRVPVAVGWYLHRSAPLGGGANLGMMRVLVHEMLERLSGPYPVSPLLLATVG